MLSLKDIRHYISGLDIAADDNVYIGKLDNKKQKSIGVYSRPSSGPANIAIGGLECTTYDTKPISILIHWNKSKDESERTAFNLYEKLRSVTSLTIGDTPINYLRLMVPEPQDVGSDDAGVYEYVIWLDFIYSRKDLVE